jgi:hypothetical protein
MVSLLRGSYRYTSVAIHAVSVDHMRKLPIVFLIMLPRLRGPRLAGI